MIFDHFHFLLECPELMSQFLHIIRAQVRSISVNALILVIFGNFTVVIHFSKHTDNKFMLTAKFISFHKFQCFIINLSEIMNHVHNKLKLLFLQYILVFTVKYK